MKDLPDVDKPRAGIPGAVKVLLGCGLVALLFGVLICGGAVYGIRVGLKKLDSFAEPFVEKGYERVTGQVIEVRDGVSKPTVYTAQVVKISADVDANVAIMAQVVEISGTVKGDIDFFGQVLMLKSGAVVEGDIRVQGAQVVDVSQGTVKGKITGPIQTLKQRPSATNSPMSEPPPPEPSIELPAESPSPPAEPESSPAPE